MTKRDGEILAFIKTFMKEHGTTPTIREIGNGVGLYSTSSVYNHVQKLIRLGEIIPLKDKSFRYRVRGMRYIEDENNQ